MDAAKIIEDPSLIHYSASQVATFTSCKRKWFWERVKGFKSPETEAQREGKILHAELERYAIDGTKPANARALDALQFIPELPLDGVYAERPIARALSNDRYFVGYCDLTDVRDPKYPKITDYKSTSSIKNYAKTDYQLRNDLQLNAYAFDTLENLTPNAERIEVRHLYLQTKGAIRSKPVPAQTTPAEVRNNWQRLLKIVDQIEEVRTETDPAKVGENRNACDDYRGCSHRARCNVIWLKQAAAKLRTEKEANEEVLLPPDTTRRKEGDPPATVDTVAPEALPKVIQKERKKMALDFSKLGGAPKTESPPKDKVEALREKVTQGQGESPAPESVKTEASDLPTPAKAKKAPKVAEPDAKPMITGSILYLDCYPVGYPAVPFGKWIAPAIAEIEKDSGADWQFHQYRSGTGELVKKARALPMPPALVVNSKTPEANVCMETLIERSSMIVQGMR